MSNHLAFRVALERAEASYEEAMAAVTQTVFQRVLTKLVESKTVSEDGLCCAPPAHLKEEQVDSIIQASITDLRHANLPESSDNPGLLDR